MNHYLHTDPALLPSQQMRARLLPGLLLELQGGGVSRLVRLSPHEALGLARDLLNDARASIEARERWREEHGHV
ncbi:hypothetical protein [Ottowia oryzae]|uniref:hypothetical protein n=1 Tax=Ottowia oryzae TaxID=2109914 RepID=UPI000F4E1847|nr:hypothetical protein [Ottowia oryzae]